MSISHGTIAFDTLTTSDQVETGTEKSLDTSYVYHGTPKAWAYSAYSSGTPLDSASLNVSSNTDTNTGDTNHNYTNNMSSTNSGATAANSSTSSCQGTFASADTATTYVRTITRNTSDALADHNKSAAVYGELA
jgi:hypothetical protein|tara:strand:+ start:366 stop:767 length:402 start_codon:yes stop_codon:yes gene_type:complete